MSGSVKAASVPEKRSSPAANAAAQPCQEQVAEAPRQHPHRQEEPRPAGHPARPVGREAAARDDAVQVWMVLQGLPPGVQHRDRADLGAEMAGVGGDGAQRLGGGPEQDGVDHALVLERDLGRRRRQGEDDMEVRHRQQFGLTRFEPFGARQALALRAMPVAAGVVGAADQAAIAALLDMAAERRRAAGLDRRHDTTLDPAEMRRHGRGGTPRRGGGRYPPPPARDASAVAQAGGVTSSRSRSSGLGVPRMVLVATCA